MVPPRSNPRITPKRSGNLNAVKNASDMQAILDKNSVTQQLLLVCYASVRSLALEAVPGVGGNVAQIGEGMHVDALSYCRTLHKCDKSAGKARRIQRVP